MMVLPLRRPLLILGAVGLWLHALHGQQRQYTTVRATHPIHLDGHFDEVAWDATPWSGDFTQTDPQPGVSPSHSTSFKILHDEANLYIAIQALDSAPDSIVRVQSARDFFDGDYVEINIDSNADEQTAFSFTATAGGIRGDEHIKSSDQWENDWNPDWTVRTIVHDTGWNAEFKIPFRSLEVCQHLPNWRIQVNRYIERSDELSSWIRVENENEWVRYFGVLTGVEHIQNTCISLNDTLDNKLLQQDFNLLLSTLENAYPSLYRYRSKEFISRNVEAIDTDLQQPRRLAEYYRLVSRFIATLGDGHMQVKMSESHQQLFENAINYFPFDVALQQGDLYITASLESELPQGTKIVAIHGSPVNTIVATLLNLIPSDGYNQSGKHQKLTKRFSYFYALQYGQKNRVQIEVIPTGKTQPISIWVSLVSQSSERFGTKQKSTPSKNKPAYTFDISEGVGTLTIRSFELGDGFHSFLEDSFKKLSAKGINKLILDLRDNGGGDEKHAIQLYRYLSDKPFRYYERYEVKTVAPLSSQPPNTLVAYETLNFMSKVSKPYGAGNSVLHDVELLENRLIDPTAYQAIVDQHGFGGRLVVLINGGSFSATSELCAVMARDKRATFVGAETGGGLEGNTSGIYDQIVLPYSRLTLRIPLLKYVSHTKGATIVPGRGVFPDFPVAAATLYTNSQRDVPFELATQLLIQH